MKIKARITIGSVMCLSGLWLGSYAFHICNTNKLEWALFPTFVTAALLGLGGLALATYPD